MFAPPRRAEAGLYGFMTDLAVSAVFPTIMALSLALGLGLLIGVQRGWALRNAPDGTRFAGIRTFGLIGLAGGLAGVLHAIDASLAIILVTACAILILLGYTRTSRMNGSVSGTASIVGLLTLGCGYLATAGHQQVASAIAVLLTVILALRSQLHGWLEHLTELEIGAIARFALIAGAILPLLPDRPYGPYDAWNPRHLWMVVVLVSGFSFIGYLACKRLGARNGTLATAGAGALVSSTAVTAALASRLREDDGDRRMLSAAIALASAVMFLRVLVLVGALAPIALNGVALLALPPAITSGIAAVWMLRSALPEPADGAHPVKIRNPFDLWPAIGMMALIMVVSVASRWMLVQFGQAGLSATLAISGAIDVDAAIITIGGLPAPLLDARTAALVLAVPMILNTLFKAATALSIAGWTKGRAAAAALALSAVACVAMLPLVARL
ncbi:hypothetical protein EBBID32_24270 [Sphingobium indicum BiD32]|uniref:DUF4010 domain-containing protein n=2 Tax=Sphingobium indicum TaxID=332055 RepID=N1MQY9_9SPHN|nr:hypothetical protein EBBID32_24270 [Sphingobium indicum BiD32]